MSEGAFVNMRPHNSAKNGPGDIDESTDTFDTIEWLIENLPNHNGRVGLWGVSYPGFYTSAGMIDSHPALKAASLQDRNPQSWVENIFSADEEDFIKATHRIYRSAEHPSAIDIGVLE